MHASCAYFVFAVLDPSLCIESLLEMPDTKCDDVTFGECNWRAFFVHGPPNVVWFLGRAGHFLGPSRAPKGPFRLARPNTLSGAPSPSPLHRGRSGYARQREKLGGECRTRRVINTRTAPNRRLSHDRIIFGARQRFNCWEGELPEWQPRD
jgi:hypothetical protein